MHGERVAPSRGSRSLTALTRRTRQAISQRRPAESHLAVQVG
jgi:hypothetical protein